MVGNDKGNFFCIPQLIPSSPYFDINYPSAINFGGLGAVIGHEISHGFDPWGSMYVIHFELTFFIYEYVLITKGLIGMVL